MKQILINSCMGLMVILFLSFLGAKSPEELNEPAVPTSVVCFFSSAEKVPQKILEYSKQRYIVKTISSASGDCPFGGCMYSIVVMEKY